MTISRSTIYYDSFKKEKKADTRERDDEGRPRPKDRTFRSTHYTSSDRHGDVYVRETWSKQERHRGAREGGGCDLQVWVKDTYIYYADGTPYYRNAQYNVGKISNIKDDWDNAVSKAGKFLDALFG